MSNTTDFQIDFETFEALAQDGEWSSFPETGELGLDAALDYAARQAATAVQQDDRFGGMDPEAGWDLIVPGTDWAYAAKDRRVRERALEALRYDRQHKGW